MLRLKIEAESDHPETPLCELVAMLDELAVKLGEQLDAGTLPVPYTETLYAASGEISVSIELDSPLLVRHVGALALED